MSIELANTLPRPIQTHAGIGHVEIDWYDIRLSDFIASAKKVLVGETIAWSIPLRGSQKTAVQMHAVVGEKSANVKIGKHTIDGRDFLVLILYVLSNTNLGKNDPRVPFLTFVKAIDGTRTYMHSEDWRGFMEEIRLMKKVEGYSSSNNSKTKAWRLSPI